VKTVLVLTILMAIGVMAEVRDAARLAGFVANAGKPALQACRQGKG
jgi:hypothetical protein